MQERIFCSSRSMGAAARVMLRAVPTALMVLALLVFGGDVIRPFAWVLTFGIVIGTFSSIYIGSPLLLYIERKYPRADVAARVGGLPGTMPAPAARPSRQPGSRPHASGPAR